MQLKELVIEAEHSNHQYWQSLWKYRELFYFLAWRDILVRYKQTALGLAWALIRPFLTMVVFTLVFGQFAKLPSQGDAPYAVMVFSALLPWQLFSSALVECGNSMLKNSHLVSKVYFPRLIIPISAVMVSFVDFLVSGMILLGLMAWYSFVPSWKILTLPLFAVMALMAILGFGIWLTALSVEYRDFQHIAPFLIQLGLYISPVGYSSAIVPSEFRLLYSLNPMVGVIDGFRWAILKGQAELYLPAVLLSLGFSSVLCITGIAYFRRVEDNFADVI